MGLDWYEMYAQRWGGYRKLWDSRVEGPDGEAAFTVWVRGAIPAHRRVLDVGCGDGLYTLHMSALAEHITGVDYAPAMIAQARRHQQSAAIPNVEFRLQSTSGEPLPGSAGAYDLIYSRRGPTSHLAAARRVLRPGGLVAGIHSGARDEIRERLRTGGFRVLREEEFSAREVMPTLDDFALYLSRIPGFADFTSPAMQAELAERAAAARTPDGYAVSHWRFIWVATPAE